MPVLLCNLMLLRLFSSYFCEGIGEVAALAKPLNSLLDPWTLAWQQRVGGFP